MSVGAVGGASGAQGSISLQEFMQVLMTQLTYQDPLKPMDNQAFLAQIAQFTTLEQTQQVNSNLQTLVSNQAAQQSVGLIGKTVTVTNALGNQQTGVVSKIDFSNVGPQLTISDSNGAVLLEHVSISQIVSVQT